MTAEQSAELPATVTGRLRRFLEEAGRRLGKLAGRLGGWRRSAPVGEPEPTPPGPVRAPGRFIDGLYGNAAGSREYKLYIPGGHGEQPSPLLVMLHGCTQSPDDFAAGTRMNELAEEFDVMVLYPAQTAAANRSRCWNWFSPDDQRRDRGEPSLIAGMTRQVMAEYRADPARVYIAGLSAGGAAAAIMGTVYPDLYAAIGVHSGLACGAANGLLSAFTAMRLGHPLMVHHPTGPRPGLNGQRRIMPTIVFHGDQDKTVHPRNGDRVIAQSKATGGLTLSTQTENGQVPGGHAFSRIRHFDSDGRVVLEQWVIHGSGHAWSGGCAKGSYIDPLGPDAAREMLRFFRGQVHPTAAGAGT